MKTISKRITTDQMTNMTEAFYLSAKTFNLTQLDAFDCVLQHATSTAVDALGVSKAETVLREMFNASLEAAIKEIKAERDKNKLN